MTRHALMIVENLPVPFDRRVWQEATTLKQNGYDVTVICPVGKGHEARHEIIEGIEIHRHALPVEGRGAVGFLTEYAAALFHEFRLALKVWRGKRFDVVHVANPPDIMFLVALPFKLLGARLIFDHHDITPELYEQKFAKAGLGKALMTLTERLSFMSADVVISTNRSYRQLAIERGGKDPSDVFIVRSSPKAEVMRLVEPDPAIRAKAGTILGYVGIMGSQDGIGDLLDILARLLKIYNVTDFHAMLVGEGPELEASRRKASELGLDNHVTFTGYMSGQALHRTLSSIDVGLCPDPCNDYTRRCTMNKIMEYMAFGKPLVQFDLDEGRYSAQDASLYAPANDKDAFVRHIIQLMGDAELRERMGAYGRLRIETALNWAAEIPSLLAAYDRALSPRAEAKVTRRTLP